MSVRVLPDGWIRVNLGDILEIKYGKSLPAKIRSGSGYPVYGSNGVVGQHDEALTKGETIIIGRKGSIGECSYSDTPCWPIDTTYFVDNTYGQSWRFWFYCLRWLDLGHLNKSTAIPGISREDAYKITLPLPSASEQKRIADKLDELLATVDACKARLDAIPAIIKRFRQAVLAAATSGQLTADWRGTEENVIVEDGSQLIERIVKERWEESSALHTGKKHRFKEPVDPDLSHGEYLFPNSWTTASVSQFADCLDSQRVPVKKELRKSKVGQYPYYGANGQVDLVDDYIFDGELVLVTEDETFYGREKPIAYRVSGKCWVNNHAHVLKTRDDDSTDYLCFALMYYNVIPWLSGTTGRAKLTQAALNALPIGIPPLVEQREIVRRVKGLFALVDGLDEKMETSRAAAEKLSPTLLGKAFRGELVPQDPNDEPAEQLLARIKSERAASLPAKAKRGRKKKASAA